MNLLTADDVVDFEGWYDRYEVDDRDETLRHAAVGKTGSMLWSKYENYKREMDQRVANYWKLEKLADAQVVSTKPDLPNISSGETAGLIRRTARNLVQNTPNVEVVSIFNDDSVEGILTRHILTAKIIGSDLYSNDMQQNLFATTKTSLTLGFAPVIPLLLQDAGGSWYIKYDSINYRDVFPEPGAKDVRQATDVFVRRYLTEGEVIQLVMDQTPGWDHNALRTLLRNRPPAREQQSVPQQTKKHHQIPDGYPIITWYNSFGKPFLTFSDNTKMLLRVEKNKHPLKQHPVHFLVMEKDDQQPLGKSQVELLYGRQEFQDLMLNGAMKMWYRNINPPIFGFGVTNAIPNLSPGKYTNVGNPNAKIEPFEVNTQTLMTFGQITQQNLGSMVSLLGTADQQMAMQSGQGMSATPQGVEAQTALVDITTNNYQKAIEAFFSHYCSYALTLYFQELKSLKKLQPTADTRIKLLEAGLKPTEYEDEPDSDGNLVVKQQGDFDEEGCIPVDFSKLATEYFVRCVPGSLTELEDEKQLRVLNQMFIPLSQAINAVAASGDQDMLRQAVSAMSYIIGKQIELSGSQSAKAIGLLWKGDDQNVVAARDARIAEVEQRVGGLSEGYEEELELTSTAIQQLQEGQAQMAANMQLLLEKLGVVNGASTPSNPTSEGTVPVEAPVEPTVSLASA